MLQLRQSLAQTSLAYWVQLLWWLLLQVLILIEAHLA